LVIGGKVAHVTRHEIAQVTGDGRSTVEQLVAKANEDPLRGPEVEQPYTLLYLEEDAKRTLIRQGLSVNSVPADGQTVLLSSICHLSTGGTAVDVTDVAHPDNIAAAERIARLIGLDICGVDFLHPDVTKSYNEVGGAILEVNQGPSFDMHDASTNSTNRVRCLVLRELSKNWNNSQIPLVRCIVDDNFPSEAAALLVLRKLHERLGLTGGVVIPALGLGMVGFATIKTRDPAVAPICDAILSDPRVEAALFFTGREPISAIPESATNMDFCSSDHSHSVESIAEAIVHAFIRPRKPDTNDSFQ
jgi:cyanophycin synthetase